MIHDSRVILTLISICNSWINLINPIYTLLLYMLSVRSMNHESRILNHPTSNPDEDAHTIAPINPWKFHSDWSSHMRAYRSRRPGNGPSPHTPLYTYAGCAGWIKVIGLQSTHSCRCCRCTWPTWWRGWWARGRRWSGACPWSASPARTSTRCRSLAERGEKVLARIKWDMNNRRRNGVGSMLTETYKETLWRRRVK